jgi:seryl-tRNA synthetase
VEVVQIAHPEKSYEVLEEMVKHVESLVQKLELPYRILRLCGGDMSFTSALTYDFEVFSAAQKMWLEVSSVSNFESFQSNRLKLRYRDEKHEKTATGAHIERQRPGFAAHCGRFTRKQPDSRRNSDS